MALFNTNGGEPQVRDFSCRVSIPVVTLVTHTLRFLSDGRDNLVI